MNKLVLPLVTLALIVAPASHCTAKTKPMSPTPIQHKSAFFPILPAAITGKGYHLSFDDEFDDLSSIDVHDTGKPGYKWYVSLRPDIPEPLATPDDFTMPEPSVLRIHVTGNDHAAAQLVSTYSPTIGKALDGSRGFYVEARIRFPTTGHRITKGSAWPAFWMLPIEKIYHLPGFHWPGQSADYIHYVEIDTMEYNGSARNNRGGSVIDWYGVWPDWKTIQNWQIRNIPYPDGKEPDNVWHIYGCLVIPSSKGSNGRGSLRMYTDNVPSDDHLEWSGVTDWWLVKPPPAGANLYAVLQNEHHAMILGTGANWPMDVDWVRAWER